MHRPSHAAAGAHGDELPAVADGEAVGHGLRLFHQGDGVGVFGQAVEAGAVFRGEGFEFVERTDLLEGFGIELDGGGGAEHAGAAAGVFFGVLRVRRGVGAEEEFV